MKKIFLIIITLGLVIGIGILFLGKSQNGPAAISTQTGQNVEIKDGIQYITITAKGGYSPETSTAKADIPTKLVIETNGTYDCSSSLIIRSIRYQKILPQTGTEIIDIGTPKAGIPLQGTCGMGMYNFVINFS